ncbi:MAG: DotU family type IV/VI secretion system protein [Planctomycetota bacterium]|jgi:type VI secretion system protein ImpK
MDRLTDVIQPGLSDVCADLFRFAFTLEASFGKEGDAEPVQRRVDEMFQDLDARAHQAEISLEEVQQAKYAIAAFIDERVLNSSLPFRNPWSSNPLQLKYFDDSAAGEEFYNRLDNLRHSTESRPSHALEIYFLCLALGFKGMHAGPQGVEKRKALMYKISQDLLVGSDWHAGALKSGPESPADRPQEKAPWPIWMLPGACIALLALMFLVLHLVLDGTVSSFFELVK